jgi:hypothetical protein
VARSGRLGPAGCAGRLRRPGSIGIDATTIDLPPIYESESTVRFTIPPGRHDVRIYYMFDDASKTGYRLQLGPYATFRLLAVGADGKPDGPLLAGTPPASVRTAGVLLDVIVVSVSLLLLCHYGWLLRFQVRPAGIVGEPIVAAASEHDGAEPWVGVDGDPSADEQERCVREQEPRRTVPSEYYESHAQTILETWSLQGAEQVFYNQPFFRYVRFAEHFLLGDGDPLIDTLAWTALQWSILWAASTLLPATGIGRARAVLFVAASGLTLVLAGSGTVVAMIRHSLSEHATWIFTAAAFPLLASRSARRWVAGAALLGAAVITRPNQSPALFSIAAAFLVPALWHRRRPAVLAGVVFCAVCSLPLAHNIYYGRRPVIFTTTADNPATLGIPVSTLARIPTDAKARADVMRDVRGLLFLPPWDTPIRNGELALALHGLQVVWIAVLCLAVGRSLPLNVRILTVVPLLYLAVHVIYDVGSYYPRHILAAYFAMGLVTMTIAATLGPRRHGGTNPGPSF